MEKEVRLSTTLEGDGAFLPQMNPWVSSTKYSMPELLRKHLGIAKFEGEAPMTTRQTARTAFIHGEYERLIVTEEPDDNDQMTITIFHGTTPLPFALNESEVMHLRDICDAFLKHF